MPSARSFVFRLTSLICLSAWALFAAAADRPNFVWLISEDNSVHYLKTFDEHGAETPRIDELAKHGVIFDRAFSNSPVCSVARTTLLTSCFGPRIGTQFHRKTVTVPMPAGVKMFPEYLRDAGYYTTNNNKKDYNAVEGNVWDESSNRASWKKRKAGQSFFHMQTFKKTHESSLHFKNMSEPTRHDPDKQFVAPYHPDTPTFRYTNARYRDNIQDVDQEIGSVVDQLKKDGLLEDTFVFYFGDHGGVLPRGKGYAYESGLHVPLVVRVPENWKHLAPKIGSRSSKMVSFVDYGPTLLALAQIPGSEYVDGRPMFGANSQPSEDEAFGYADRFDEKIDFVRNLRHGKYEYVRSYQPFNFDGLQNNYRYKMLAFEEWRQLYKAGKLNAAQRAFFETRAPEALYDIEADPHEVNDLATDPKYADVLAEMRTRLNQRVKSMPDLSFYPESHLVDAAFENPVEFGQEQKQAIAKLVDISNLQLVEFESAKSRIEAALKSSDRWQRYWGLIVCTTFGEAASPFYEHAKSMADGDEENLVRLRAAEFLAMTGQMDPREIVMDTLTKSRHGVEANLVLNSLVLLRDGKTKYEFNVPKDLSKPQPGVAEMQRRLLYLNP